MATKSTIEWTALRRHDATLHLTAVVFECPAHPTGRSAGRPDDAA